MRIFIDLIIKERVGFEIFPFWKVLLTNSFGISTMMSVRYMRDLTFMG